MGHLGVGADDLWMVGQNGVIVHYDGVAFTQVSSPTDCSSSAIWGASASDIWAVGINGIMLHYDGKGWSTPRSYAAQPVRIWGRGPGDAYAVGNTGEILRLTGNTWAPVQNVGSGENLRGCGATTPGDRHGGMGRHGDSRRRQLVDDRDDFARAGDGVGAAGGPTWAAGAGGVVFRRGTTGWTQEPFPPSHALFGIHGNSGTNVYAVGDTGTILHYNGTAWAPQASPRNVLLRSVWAAGPDLAYIVGEFGTILISTAIGWGAMASPTTGFLRHVWGLSAGNVYAVGDSGSRAAISMAAGGDRHDDAHAAVAARHLGHRGLTTCSPSGRPGRSRLRRRALVRDASPDERRRCAPCGAPARPTCTRRAKTACCCTSTARRGRRLPSPTRPVDRSSGARRDRLTSIAVGVVDDDRCGE